MSRTPLLLIETLDCAGAAAEDGALRGAVLRQAGFAPQVLTIAPPDRSTGQRALDAAAASNGGHLVAWRDGRSAVRALLASRPFEQVIVASAMPGGGEVTRWLPADRPARWWPAALAAAERPQRRPWGAARALDAIGGGGDAKAAGAIVADAALDWAIVDASALSRRHQPLWDGDTLLAPAPLAGVQGEALLVAFAAAASEHVALDLIVLADPQPAFERIARGLGIGMRVHFAGGSTREAEWAWLKPASGLLVSGAEPLAAGIVLRALACGCPVLGAGEEGVGPALNAWLAAHGAAPAAGRPIRDALLHLLDRADPVERAIERGKRASDAHHVAPLAARLAVRPADAPAAAAAPGAPVPGRQAA